MLSPDVREILDDPEVGGGVSFIIQRPKQIRMKSAVKLVMTEIPATGNIQPVSLSMTPGTNEDQLDEQIVIRTTAILQSGTRDETGTYQADEITWHGQKWRVTRVDNWADWGFTVGYATRVRE